MAVRSFSLPRTLPHVDRRFLVAGVLAAVSAALVLLLTQPPERTPILVAANDLPVGHTLTAGDVGVRQVEDSTGLVVGDTIGALAGYSLAVPLRAGEPLLAPILRAPQVVEASQSLSLAVPIERAVLGRIAAGDLVDIYVTRSSAGIAATTSPLARGVYVIDAAVTDRPGGRNDVLLVLAVDESLAPQLAGAAHSGTIDVVRVAP